MISSARIRAYANLACLRGEDDQRLEEWLGKYEESGVLSFALAAVLLYHYEDVVRGRVRSVSDTVAAARLEWLRRSADSEIANSGVVREWALESSRSYFKGYYAHLPEYHYNLAPAEAELLTEARAWLRGETKLRPLEEYECVAMPRSSDDPLLHYPAQIPSKVLSIVSINPDTGHSQPPIILTPAGVSLSAEERVITLVHESLHISQLHPPQTDSLHSSLVEGITDALSLLATGRGDAITDYHNYLGDYEAELKLIVVVHLAAQKHRHQSLLQTLRDLHEELNVPELSRDDRQQYVRRVLTHYTRTELDWNALYALAATTPTRDAAEVYAQITGEAAPELRLVNGED